MEVRLLNNNTTHFEDVLTFLCDKLFFDYNIAKKITFEAHNKGFYPIAFVDRYDDLDDIITVFEQNHIPYDVVTC